MNTINTMNLEWINDRNLNWLEKFGLEDTPNKGNPVDELADIGKIYGSILRKNSGWDSISQWGLPEIKE